MEKLKIKEAIVVEGRYDKNSLSQVVDTLIIETGGFGIFSNGEKLNLLKKIAETRGLVILTDGDAAGFLIRNHIKGAIPSKYIKQAYIPDIQGKERRKTAPSKEGKLGVEGMKPETLIKALLTCGATVDESSCIKPEERITKADFYSFGLSGTANSADKRQRLIKKLGLPEHMSCAALLDVVNMLYDRSTFSELIDEIDSQV